MKVVGLKSSFKIAANIFEMLANAIEDAGGSEADLRRLETDSGLRRKLADLIVGSVNSVFKIWKTIKLGTGLKTADDFRRALKQGGYRIGDWANDILGQPGFKASTEEKEADLAVVSVAELGFPNGATREDIYRKAQELGLEFCPPEVGPQLRLQYKDQPNGEWLLIGMKPITGSDDNLPVFSVGRDDGALWLSSSYGSPGGFREGYYRWVFLRRK